jgi:hypothetical protein
MWSAFQIRWNSFSKWAASGRCYPSVRMVTALNFHIKAWSVRTMKTDVQTVELMHTISIYKAWASEQWRLTFGRLNFVCTTCLIKDSVRMGTHIVLSVVAVFPYLCFGKKSHSWKETLNWVQTCCWDARMDVTWNSSKLLYTEEGPDGKFSLSRGMMFGHLSIGTEYHVVRCCANIYLNK